MDQKSDREVHHFEDERSKGWYTLLRREDGGLLLDGKFRTEGWPLTIEGEFKGGALHGTMSSMGVTGGGIIETYVGGRLHGIHQVFDENGTVLTEGHYDAGVRSGVWTYRDGDGNVLRTETYDNGKLVE